MKIKSLRNNLFIVFLALGLFSCRPNEIYTQFAEIKDAEWDRDETFYFEVDSSLFELNTSYDITIELTNNINYPYKNIWLYLTHNLNDTIKDTDTQLEYYLADDEGRWYGGGFGSLYQTSLIFKKNYRFTEKRNYIFGISHNMVDNPLKGVERIGVNVTKVE